MFAHDQEVVRTFSDVWPWLLGAALCLLPLDVGVRRVTIDLGELRRAWDKVRVWWGRVVRRGSAAKQPPEQRLSRLMEAKSRAQVEPGIALSPGEVPQVPVGPDTVSEAAQGEDGQVIEASVAAESEFETETMPPASEPGIEEQEGSMTSRLLAAKRRAQRRD